MLHIVWRLTQWQENALKCGFRWFQSWQQADIPFSLKYTFLFQDGSCGNGWVCEHRWPQIYSMVAFRKVAAITQVNDWWDNGSNQIAFCRGAVAFVAFNNDLIDFDETLQVTLCWISKTCYCDIRYRCLV